MSSSDLASGSASLSQIVESVILYHTIALHTGNCMFMLHSKNIIHLISNHSTCPNYQWKSFKFDKVDVIIHSREIVNDKLLL